MRLINTKLEGVYIIENFNNSDRRGSFTKTYHEGSFKENNLSINFRESYFSVSRKDVIRGMHFQLPPYEHEKLVYVAKGEILDVILDLRKNSKTYGDTINIKLSDKNHKSIYISKGFAHGFKSIIDNSITVYNVTTVHNDNSDFGIKYDTFGYDWKINQPILSNRDNKFISFKQFAMINPF